MQTENFSIIHGCDGVSFKRHYVSQNFQNRCITVFIKFSCVYHSTFLLMLLQLKSSVISSQTHTNTGYSATIVKQVSCYCFLISWTYFNFWLSAVLSWGPFFFHHFKYNEMTRFSFSNARLTGALINQFNVLRYWKLRKYLQPSPWLHDWMRREIQALTQVTCFHFCLLLFCL